MLCMFCPKARRCPFLEYPSPLAAEALPQFPSFTKQIRTKHLRCAGPTARPGAVAAATEVPIPEAHPSALTHLSAILLCPRILSVPPLPP